MIYFTQWTFLVENNPHSLFLNMIVKKFKLKTYLLKKKIAFYYKKSTTLLNLALILPFYNATKKKFFIIFSYSFNL